MKKLIKEIKIQEAWWSAWKTFGWAKGIWGVGFSVKEVEKGIADKKIFRVTVGKYPETYLISPITIKNYAEKNKTIYTARYKTKLYVVPNIKLNKERK